MSKRMNRGFRKGFDLKIVNSQSLKVTDFDHKDLIDRCLGTTASTNLDSQAGFAKGAFYVKTNAATGIKSTYENVGTTTSSSFNLLGEIAASDITLANGDYLVGNASGVGVAVTLGGDVTSTNAGVVTVASATGTWGTPGTTTTSGAGAVAITGSIHEVTTTGTGDALTLADGAEGQHLHIVYVAEGAGGDTAILTPTNLAGANSTVTFADLGDASHLLFTAGAWYFLGGEATVA